MNTALIAHILNQRLAKHEIWPSWWDGSRWNWPQVMQHVWVWLLLFQWVFLRWGLSAETPIAAVGRTIYTIALGATATIISNLSINMFQPRLQSEIDRHNLELSILPHGMSHSALLTWFLADLATLLLRFMRIVPLYAFAALAGGIAWSEAVWFVLFVSLIATASLALLYAATITDPIRFMMEFVLMLAIGWWLYKNVDLSILTFGYHYRQLSFYLAVLAITTVVALVWAAAALEFRLRWHSRRGGKIVRPRWRNPSLLRRWPVLCLLLCGLRRGLGIFGSTPAVIVTTATCIGIGMIPVVGGFLLLLSLVAIVPQFILALHRARVWDDVYLASVWKLLPANDARDWAKALIATCCVATCPLVPGLVAHVALGRFAITDGWSIAAIAVELSASGKHSIGAIGGAFSIIVAAVACVVSLYLAFVTASLESFVYTATRKVDPWKHISIPMTVLFVTVFIAACIVFPSLVRNLFIPSSKAYALGSLFTLIAIIASIVVVWSYRDLRHLMEHARGLSAYDYEEAWLMQRGQKRK